MADFGDFASGAVGGAMAGASFGPPGAIIGGAIGGIASLFGDSADQKRKKRLDDQLAANARIKAETEGPGFLALGGKIQQQMSAARQAAIRRAAAMGKMGGGMEAFLAPIESRVQEAGGQELTRYREGIDRTFASANLAAESEYAGSPITPSTGETLGVLGQGIAQFRQNKDYIKILKGFGGGGGNNGSWSTGGWNADVSD